MPLRPESWPIPPFPEKPATPGRERTITMPDGTQLRDDGTHAPLKPVMPTKSEAAEALYRAAEQARLSDPRAFWPMWDDVRDALNAYRTSTPDPLPAEVQRVLEAADAHLKRVETPMASGPCDTWLPLVAAIRAYRSTQQQPEPLSTRLARLKPGSVVEDQLGWRYRVKAVDVEANEAWCRSIDVQNSSAVLPFDRIACILSESP